MKQNFLNPESTEAFEKARLEYGRVALRDIQDPSAYDQATAALNEEFSQDVRWLRRSLGGAEYPEQTQR